MLCSIARSRLERFHLEFHTESHSAESQRRQNFFKNSALSNIARSYFAQPLKQQYIKRTIDDLAYPMAVK
jgi:hypothetical protein